MGGDGGYSDEGDGDGDGDGDGQCKFDGEYFFISTLGRFLGSVIFWPFVGIFAPLWYSSPR